MAEELPEGTVTVLFTDIVGSTELTNRLGDDAGRGLLREVDSMVRSRIAHHRGIQVKGLGDGQMVAFTSARRAVLCAMDIQKSLSGSSESPVPSSLGMRIGLHTGEVIREEGDLFGATVNFAARVAAQGHAKEILLSGTTRSLLGSVTDISFEERGEVELKGFPGNWPIFAVAWQSEVRDFVAGSGVVPYVGREPERAVLRGALARAMEGTGGIVLLSGEGGIGKTRLAEELIAEARAAGCFAVIGHCYDMDVAAPFLPFMEALDYAARVVPPDRLRVALGSVAAEVARIAPRLRQVFPDLGPPADLPPEQARHYLFSCVGDYLQNATAMQPTVLVLDDLHWADDSTSLLLEHVAHRCADMSLLVIGTYRDSDLSPSQPFARAIDRLARNPNVRRVALRRFPREGVRALLQGMSGREPPPSLVHLVTDETEGVPLFVQELYRYLAEEGRLFDEGGAWRTDIAIGEVEVPEGVRLIISRRLDHVSEDAQRVLTLASVIGRGFTFELLAKLDNGDEDAILDALDEAEAAHLLVASTGREAQYASPRAGPPDSARDSDQAAPASPPSAGCRSARVWHAAGSRRACTGARLPPLPRRTWG
jgi:class 3 adenylate cyclase